MSNSDIMVISGPLKRIDAITEIVETDYEVISKGSRHISFIDNPNKPWDVKNNRRKYKGLDINSVPSEAYGKIKLACFDVDCTVVNTELFDEIALKSGRKVEFEKITADCMSGSMEFRKGFVKKVSILKGLELNSTHICDIEKKLTPGIIELFRWLKGNDIKTSLIGGTNLYTPLVAHILNADYYFCNSIEIIDNIITGDIKGEILSSEVKYEIMQNISFSLGIRNCGIMAIGDGANDLDMMEKAGIGIAYKAKEKVRKRIPIHIDYGEISDAAYICGI